MIVQNTSVSITTADLKDGLPTVILSQLGRLDGAIEKEFTLVSDRMVWMVISESFIFGAFVTAVVNYRKGDLSLVILSLIVALPIVGILIALFVLHAINAAHAAAGVLKQKRERLEMMFAGDLRVTLVSSKQDSHAAGNVPPKYLPWVFVITWLGLLTVAIVEMHR
ncbi:MAG: hypothetical protein JNG89_04710 [Planctomycetaceae bacterium]|nr:hypothetical protein [Planctomycetaceae bacterium]